MFKDLKVVKIILFLFLAVLIASNQINEHKNTEFIFNPLSYNSQDTLSFSVVSNSSSQNHKIKIKSIISEKIILDSSLNINKTYDYFSQVDFLTLGYPTERQSITNLSLSSGIYLVNNLNPFVVSKNTESDVTIVFPTANNLFYTAEKDRRIFESDSSYTSTVRPLELDVWTKGMISFFKNVEKEYNVNYITDLDLENFSFLAKTKLVVLYGNLTFWSPKMLKNVERFIADGGKLFITSSDVFYAKFCFDQYNQSLEVSSCNEVESTLNSKIQSWNSNVDIESFSEMRYSFHSNYGGENIDRFGVDIKESGHPIFKNLDLLGVSKVLDVGEHYLGVPGGNRKAGAYLKDTSSKISIIAQTNCKWKEHLDRLGGVFEFQKENGGRAIILGTSDLCLKEQQEEEITAELFLNIMSYLLPS